MVQNASARIITRSKKHYHITPILQQLHCLQIPCHIDFKILLTYKVLHRKAPKYLQDLLTQDNKCHEVHSNNKHLFQVPKTASVRYGNRLFKYAAPTLWTPQPISVKECHSVDLFKSKLNTHLFEQAFGR